MTSRRELLAQAASLGGAITALGTGALGATKTNAASRASKSRNFVLVHGAFHGGWCYQRVADIRHARGHRAYTPTLTGLGERSHLTGFAINCSTHMQDVINVIRWERLDDVILCGHSYGGIVVGGVADALAERIAAIVYLDSPLPENGRSVFDLLPQAQTPFVAAAGEGGGFLVKPAASAAKALGVNAADQEMVEALLTPHPLASFCEPLKLTGAYMRIARKIYIKAKGFKNVLPLPTLARLNEDPEWQTFEIPSGHDVMIDAPAALADVLLSLV